jgi:hypothetical protein
VLRVLPAPVVEPPADGQDWNDPPEPASAPRYVQGRLAVDLRHRHDDSFFGPQATSTPDLPEAGPWALRMIRAVLEAYEGSRSPDQLSRWVVPRAGNVPSAAGSSPGGGAGGPVAPRWCAPC